MMVVMIGSTMEEIPVTSRISLGSTLIISFENTIIWMTHEYVK